MTEIQVKVHQWGEGRAFMLRWTDPVSGKRKTKSAGTTDYGQAEREAAKLEVQLRAGHAARPSAMTWKQFVAKYDEEKLSAMKAGTRDAYLEGLRHVTRVLAPDRLARLTSAAVTTFVSRLRKEGMIPTTIAKHLRSLRAALRWAHRQAYLDVMPSIDMPKGTDRMKGRAITGEEFDRLVAAVPKVRPADPEPWRRLLHGLWLSGLRLGEAVALSWDDGPFQIDLGGRHPAFRIQGEGQKSGRAEVCPAVPDFIEWLLVNTPPSDRRGRVFPLPVVDTRDAGKVLSAVGETAGVVVSKERRMVREWVKNEKGKRTGERRLVEKEVVKYASAHDLRRSFGSRWARKVMPAVLQRLMRHADIKTTMAFYVDLDADEVAADLWRNHVPADIGNIFGNSGSKTAVAKGE